MLKLGESSEETCVLERFSYPLNRLLAVGSECRDWKLVVKTHAPLQGPLSCMEKS